MALIRVLLKILAVPVFLFLTLVKWIGIFLTSFSAFFFHMIAGLFFLVAVSGFVMDICSGADALSTLAIGFIFYAAPFAAEWLLTRISMVSYHLSEFLRS